MSDIDEMRQQVLAHDSIEEMRRRLRVLRSELQIALDTIEVLGGDSSDIRQRLLANDVLGFK